MASGNSLFVVNALSNMPPGTIFALQHTIVGTSTPAEGVRVLKFDQTTAWYADFWVVMPQHYAGGGLTCVICSSAAVTAGGVTWEIAFRRVADDAEDLDTTAHTYDYNSLDIATLPSAIGEVSYDNITFTDGADMDSWAAGEAAILRIKRNVAAANDTAAGYAYLHSIEVRET